MTVFKQIVKMLQSPFQKLPESRFKNGIRINLWKYLSAGMIHPSIHLMRRPLLISPGDNVLLVGCSGEETLREVAELIGPSGSILIIEADRERRKKLQSAKILPDVKFESRGAWSSEGKLHFEKNQERGGGLVVEQEGDYRLEADYGIDKDVDDENNFIEVASLQTITDDNDFVPDYIELATNGTEPEILSGGKELFLEASCKVYMKNYAFGGAVWKNRSHLLLEMLDEVGYEYVFSPTRPLPGKIHESAPDGDIFAWDPGMY